MIFMRVRVQADDFDPGQEIARLTQGRADVGAVASFVGCVRDRDDQGRVIKAMTLEQYPAMTQAEMSRIAHEAQARWPLQDLTILHRHGRLEPGARIVLVAVASAHRQAAFEACAFLMDFLKTRAPFWKKEETDEGAQWVSAKESDDLASERWNP